MRRYVTISAGPRAEEAVPVISSSDDEVVDATLLAIRRRLRARGESDASGPAQTTNGGPSHSAADGREPSP
jgi:hypothetical protein